MKKIFFLVAFTTMSILSTAQSNQLVWANGRLLYGTPVESMDSLTYDEMQDIDTLHLLLPRILIQVVYDTVVETQIVHDTVLEIVHDTVVEVKTQIVHDTVYVNIPCPDTPSPSDGIGVFSVSATKQVTFSPGNLQYTQSTNTWSFASAQYEILGTDNVIGGSVTSDATFGDMKLGTALADKVDLFYWSTAATNFGVSTSVNYNDYSGSFVDWGTNQIGNDAPNTWRTLTYDEWYYLRFSRTNANDLCGAAQVNGVNGLIFLSDNWSCPAGVTFKAGFHSNIPEDLSGNTEYFAAYQTFTADQWSKLEAAGAIFLPAAGKRYAYCVDIVQSSGYYSPAERNSYYGDYFIVTGNGAGPIDVTQHLAGSVRLVKDVR